MNKDNSNDMMPQKFYVDSNREETHDTFTLYLSSEDSSKKFHFEPGQFNMLYGFGVGEVPISISGDTSSPGTLIHTIREVGAVTKALRKLKQGDYVGVRGPFGSSWPVEKAFGKDVVVITGGIGLAPLRPALYQILAQRNDFRHVVILYGARSPQDILYRKMIVKWRAHLDLQVRVTVDQADKEWYGTVGVVTKLISKARFDPGNTVALVCGPEIMMRFTIKELQKTGIKEEDIYVSMERNMKCAIGFCGHCQYGPKFICKDGPVFSFDQIRDLFRVREI